MNIEAIRSELHVATRPQHEFPFRAEEQGPAHRAADEIEEVALRLEANLHADDALAQEHIARDVGIDDSQQIDVAFNKQDPVGPGTGLGYPRRTAGFQG